MLEIDNDRCLKKSMLRETLRNEVKRDVSQELCTASAGTRQIRKQKCEAPSRWSSEGGDKRRARPESVAILP